MLFRDLRSRTEDRDFRIGVHRHRYQNIWIEHAQEDQDPDEEPLDLEKERRVAQYTFDSIYKHGKHPPNLEF